MYTYGEIGRRVYSLIDEDPANLNTANGYFTALDFVTAVEMAEHGLFMRLKRMDETLFRRWREGVVFPAGSPSEDLDAMLRETVWSLVGLAHDRGDGAFSALDRVTPGSEADMTSRRPTGSGDPRAYMWLQPRLWLYPRQGAPVNLRVVYVAGPSRLRLGGTDPNAADPQLPAAGGFADARSYPVLPGKYHHLLILKSALTLLAKRKEAPAMSLLMSEYREALEAVLDDAASSDTIAEPSGRPPVAAGDEVPYFVTGT